MAIDDPSSMADAAYLLNMKAVADAGAQLVLGAAQGVTTHMKRVDVVAETLVGRLGATLVQPDPMEAAAAKQILTGHAGSDNVTATALGQIMAKIGQTTPPVTAYGPVTVNTPS